MSGQPLEGAIGPAGPAVATGRAGRPPTGTVTFLFTDIEGSTALLERVGVTRYETALARHREILRAAFDESAGTEIQTEGDSFFVVFGSAQAALAGAVAGQRRLNDEPWPAGEEIRVRMGLHTGDGALDRDDKYVGPDVHRAARVAAAGHGGQVVISASTRALIGVEPLPGVTLRDLGEHQLKDLKPERLYDLRIAGLATEFPPLRAVQRRADSLPRQLTSFVGREREVAALGDLLADARLVTITGPGGIGKTRLAIAAAAAIMDRFPDGVAFVALEPISDPMLVGGTIARALGIVESGSRPVLDTLLEYVATHRLLLVLDNFDQVVGAASAVGDLVRAGAGLRALVTSRAALRVSGEREYPLGGLASPPDVEHLSEEGRTRLSAAARRLDRSTIEGFEAVRLFIERGGEARSGFTLTDANAPTVGRIAARLDGLPLAIELAAARLRVLGPEAILDRLDRSLDFLASTARDLPERQRTLRAAIAWSYDLLDPTARHLLDRLAVFRGGFELEMAERVVGPAEVGIDVLDGIATLVDQSLVRRDEGNESRFVMSESIRAFAFERLGARGEVDEICTRHANAFVELAEEAEPFLQGDAQRGWLERLERANENFRAALAFATARALTPIALRLVAALWRFWQKRGYLAEGRRAAVAAVALPGARDDPRLAARAYEALGGITWWQGVLQETFEHYQESLALWRVVGDQAGIANAAYNLGLCGYITRNWDDSTKLFEEALALYEELHDDRGIGNVQWGYGQAKFFGKASPSSRIDSGFSVNEDYGAQALARFESAREHFRRAGDTTMEAWSVHMSALAKAGLGRPLEALPDLHHALRHFLEAGDLVGAALILDDFALTAAKLGEYETSLILISAVHEFENSTGASLFQASQALYPEAWSLEDDIPVPSERQAELRTLGRALSFDEAVALARTIGGSEASAAAAADAAHGR